MPDDSRLHENLVRQDVSIVGSERGFGIVFAVFFVIIGIFPLMDALPVRFWAMGLSASFLAAAFFAPDLLKPLNRCWHSFGLMLQKVVNPLVMGLLFFFTVTPIALIMRLFGKDPLQQQFIPAAKSYWIERDPPGPAPDSMRQQF
jgi:hypothetical protein